MIYKAECKKTGTYIVNPSNESVALGAFYLTNVGSRSAKFFAWLLNPRGKQTKIFNGMPVPIGEKYCIDMNMLQLPPDTALVVRSSSGKVSATVSTIP